MKPFETELTPRSSQSIRRRRRLWRNTCVFDGTPQRGAPPQPAGAGGVPGSGRNFSGHWKNSESSFRGLEEKAVRIPIVGRFRLAESQRVPRLGKIQRISSRRWKFCGPVFRALPLHFVPLPPLRVSLARLWLGWKIRDGLFQGLERIPCPRQGSRDGEDAKRPFPAEGCGVFAIARSRNGGWPPERASEKDVSTGEEHQP